MIKLKFKGSSIAILSVIFIGAMIGSSFGAAMFVQGGTTSYPTTLSGPVVMEASYIIFKDSSGYTCAKNGTTSAVDFRATSSKLVIQKAIDASSNGNIWIKSGTYEITTAIYSLSTSIIGDGNGTILKAAKDLRGAVILVTNNYVRADGKTAVPTALQSTVRPSGVSINNLQIDGNRAARTSGVIEGIGMINALNCQISKVYAHDILAGQGFYMSNSHYCSVRDSWIYNIGDTTLANYGSGIAFGEASTTKTACSNILIDNVKISKASMSSIDLEPANNITITNCQFLDASRWNGAATPVITLYEISGYKPNDNIIVSNNKVYGAFGEFIILTPSNYSIVSNNIVTYTAGTAPAIYAMDSHDNKITGNIIKTVSKDGFVGVNCNSFLISDNTIIDTTTSKSDYGIRFYATSTGTCYNNVVKGNQVSGFQYAIQAITGCNHTIVTSNVIKSCSVGVWLKGTDVVRTGNILNGSGDW